MMLTQRVLSDVITSTYIEDDEYCYRFITYSNTCMSFGAWIFVWILIGFGLLGICIGGIWLCVRQCKSSEKDQVLVAQQAFPSGDGSSSADHRGFNLLQIYKANSSRGQGQLDPRAFLRSTIYLVFLCLIVSGVIEMYDETFSYSLLSLEFSANIQRLKIDVSGDFGFGTIPYTGQSVTWNVYCGTIRNSATRQATIELFQNLGISIPGPQECALIDALRPTLYTAIFMFTVTLLLSIWGTRSVLCRGLIFVLGWILCFVAFLLWIFATKLFISSRHVEAGAALLLILALGLPFIITFCVPKGNLGSSGDTIVITQSEPTQPPTTEENPQQAKTEDV